MTSPEQEAKTDASRRVRRRRVPAKSGRPDGLGLALLAISLGGSLLVFAAQQTPVLVVAALLAAASAWLLRGSSTPRAVWLLVALAFYTLLQVMPLPLSWLRRLSPASATVWEGALRPFGAPPPEWVTLSVDPAGTALEALKWFTYACVFIAASGFCARRGAPRLALVVFGCGVLATVVTLAHGVFDIQRVYGMYATPSTSPWHRGPLLNGNNLAGYVNLALFAGVGLWLSPERKLPVWPFVLAVPILAAQVLLSESRAGIACLLAGALFVGYRSLRAHRIGKPGVRRGIAAALAAGVAFAVALGWSRLLGAFADRDVYAKVSVWRWSLDMIRDFPVFGVGRGAFEPAFEPYRRLLGRDWTVVFPYAENFPLQWASEWGPAVALVGLAAAAAFAYASFSRAARDPLAECLAVGLVALLCQNLVDLGLELYSIAALAVVAFAALGGTSESTPRGATRASVIALSGVAVATALVLATGATPVRIERQQVFAAYSAWVRNKKPDPAGFLRTLRAPMLRHPGEAYFPLVGSIPAAHVGGDPLRWIGRALERSPLDGQAHLRLADVMASRGARRQALLHLRLAAVYDRLLRDTALARAVALARTAEDLVSAFPRDVPGAALLSEVCARAAGALRVACWREAVRRDANDLRSVRELAAGLLEALEGAGEPCREARVEECKRELRQLLGRADGGRADFRVQELRARELAVSGRLRDAAALILEHCPANREAAECCARGVEYARAAKDFELLGAAAERYTAAVCTDPRACSLAHELVGRSYAELSAHGKAFRHFSTAAEQDPSADRWIQSGEAAARAGSAISARVSFDRARREGTLSVDQSRRIDAIEATLSSLPTAR